MSKSKSVLPDELKCFVELIGTRVRYSVNGSASASRYGELLAVDDCLYPFTVRDGRSVYFCKAVFI